MFPVLKLESDSIISLNCKPTLSPLPENRHGSVCCPIVSAQIKLPDNIKPKTISTWKDMQKLAAISNHSPNNPSSASYKYHNWL
jgi:hypothetical protein